MSTTINTESIDQSAVATRGLLYAALCVAITIQYLYLFSYNSVPALRLPLAGALTVLHLALAALMIMVRPAPWSFALILSVGLFILAMIPAHFMGYGEVPGFDASSALRILILPLMMIWVLSCPLALPVRLIWLFSVVGVLLCAYVAFTGPPVYMGYNYTDPRLAAFTGGDDTIHPSAKYLVLQLVLIDLLRRGRLMSPPLAHGLVALCLVVLLGYAGRNQLVFVVSYYLALVYFRWNRITLIRWSPPLLACLFLTASLIALQLGSDVASWGSGRIGVWQYRIVLIWNRDIVPFLFGGGVNADFIWTPEWSFADEGMSAHNDYLHIIMDHGIVGLIAIATMIAGLWSRVFVEGRAVLIAMLINSFFSNGFFQSPLLAMLLALVLSVSMLATLNPVVVEPSHPAPPD
ncbi:MAG: hypothetical protein H6852_17165 [Geminicoccaceae bacterium]|jgi:hypothetical protein|nr:hypothetical protein [Geminicoccaceae bacterium]MCB9969350.1 hypothetical protein [Geminicoccaceae bacterium]